MTRVRITNIGDSAGVILTEEMLTRLRVGTGDLLYAIETPRGIELIPHDSEVAKQFQVAEGVMKDHQNVLRKLSE